MVSIFFFKQKTAYEMRISDWSSDVCSSDLHESVFREVGGLEPESAADVARDDAKLGFGNVEDVLRQFGARGMGDRKSVVYGKSVSVRVDLGGRRIIKKNK